MNKEHVLLKSEKYEIAYLALKVSMFSNILFALSIYFSVVSFLIYGNILISEDLVSVVNYEEVLQPFTNNLIGLAVLSIIIGIVNVIIGITFDTRVYVKEGYQLDKLKYIWDRNLFYSSIITSVLSIILLVAIRQFGFTAEITTVLDFYVYMILALLCLVPIFLVPISGLIVYQTLLYLRKSTK